MLFDSLIDSRARKDTSELKEGQVTLHLEMAAMKASLQCAIYYLVISELFISPTWRMNKAIV